MAQLVVAEEIDILRVAELRSCLSVEVNALFPDWKAGKFLVSRQNDIEKASILANQWAQWYKSPIMRGATYTPEDFANGMCMEDDPNEPVYSEFYPHSFQGVDIEQRPVYWEKIGVGAS